MLPDIENNKPLIATHSQKQKRKMRIVIDSKESDTIKQLHADLRLKDQEIERLKKGLKSDQQHPELRLAFKQLQDFLAMSPVSIYFKNKNLEYTYANHAFAALVNLPIDELTGISNSHLPMGEYLKQLEQVEVDVLKKKEAIRNREIQFSLDDQQQLMKVYVFPMKNEIGNVDGVMVYCLDLSERIQFKQELKNAQEKASSGIKSKHAFLANLSHEIRTPLHGILGSGALLKSFLKENHALDLLDNINRSGASLLEMVNSMLLFESLEKGEWTLKKESFNLRNLVQEVNGKFEEQVKHKLVDLQSFTAQGLPDILVGDVEKIKLILNIFLSNAVKFTDKGFVHLFVQAEQKNGRNIRLKFSVKDTGPGIKKDLQPQLFSSFTQGDSSSTKGYQGTGMGLAMAEKTISYLGGAIGFESAEFKGSNFWFTVDLDDLSAEAKKKEVLTPAQLPVLLVEDNKINQKIAFFTLKKLGFTVEIAENGLEAVEQFQAGEFKIVLMDIQMPVMNGFDATVKIRALEKTNNLNASLIIAISANTIKEDIKKCFLVGMNEYISKPFSPDKLIEVIQKHVEIQLP
jgi:signal transduction histidine kinase/CheY-like chemotaxis protein